MNNTNDLQVSFTRSPTQARGRVRREKMLQAAAELLREKDLDEITFNEVAKRAEIPIGSAYYFYDNLMDLYAALTKKLGAELLERHSEPMVADDIKQWEDIIAIACKRGKEFYDKHPEARQLMIGGKTPPELKRSDRDNDISIVTVLNNHLSHHFELPNIPNVQDILFYTVEIVDLFLCLSMLRHNCVTQEMVEEGCRAGVSYLRTYLPSVLPKAN